MTASSSEKHTDDLLELMSPDGYYTFLGVEKATVVSTSNEGGVSSRVSEVDEEAVKKAYRKLSRKHHPDKGGDAETFKGLARAYRVLGNSKLREQYDILGIDLDDDLTTNEAGKGSLDGDDMGEDSPQSTAQGIVQEIASLALSAIIQLTVRTVMLGAVSVFLIRYRLALYPMLLFLGYIAVQIAGKASLRGGSVYETTGPKQQMSDVLSPLAIAVGLLLMHSGRNAETNWTWIFWMGESVVIVMFALNSLEFIPRTAVGIVALSLVAGLLALCFRGKFWNYSIVIGLEVFMALFVALAFPVVEMVLETVLNEKLRKVGEKIRTHHRQMEAYYKAKLEKK